MACNPDDEDLLVALHTIGELENRVSELETARAELERDRDEARRELRALEWLASRVRTELLPEGTVAIYGDWEAPLVRGSYAEAATALGWKDNDG